jgi:hypothetical protein
MLFLHPGNDKLAVEKVGKALQPSLLGSGLFAKRNIIRQHQLSLISEETRNIGSLRCFAVQVSRFKIMILISSA